MLPKSEIEKSVSYDPETGIFTRIHSRQKRFTGKPAGSIGARGYRVINIGNCDYTAHRLAWVLMTGSAPSADIDHVNGDRADNRWCNLRAATRSLNIANSKIRSTNKTGFKGVQRYRGKGERYLAVIGVKGKYRHLGIFDTAEEAHAAYSAAANELFGEFANDGK